MKGLHKFFLSSVILHLLFIFPVPARTTQTAGSIALGNLASAISQYAKDTNGSLPSSWGIFKDHCELCRLTFEQADQHLDVTRKYAWVPNSPEVTIRGDKLRLVIAPISDAYDRKTAVDEGAGRTVEMPGRRVILMDSSLNTKLEWFPEAEFVKLIGSVGLETSDLSAASESPKNGSQKHEVGSEPANDAPRHVDESRDKGKEHERELPERRLPWATVYGGAALLLLAAFFSLRIRGRKHK